MSYHVSNLGRFGTGIPTDLDGYVHETALGWLNAPMDWGFDDPESRLERAEELAHEARLKTAIAEEFVSSWQEAA